jgi:hypothetical protein
MKLLTAVLISIGILLGMPVFASTLNDEEIKDLLYITEEEKLAHDVYLAFQRKYRERVFPNIRRSEQNHMNAMAGLLQRYGLENPSRPAAGQFEDQSLQELYDELIASGSESRGDAIRVGARIEEKDMIDIVNAMERTDEAASKRVYSNLLAGSENHLRAFVSRLQRLGVKYEPVLLTQDAYEAIVGN